MKCLLYRWNSYFADDITELLDDCGISYDLFDWKFVDYENDDAFRAWFDQKVQKDVYDFVLSINFWPEISKACHSKGYKYIAWCYDCPINVLHPENTLNLSNNYVYMFDREQCRNYNSQGIDTVHHLKLGVNKKRVERFKGKFIDGKAHDMRKYGADIALVGSLYESQLSIITEGLNDATKQVLNEMIAVQENLYGRYIIGMCVTDDLINMMNAQYRINAVSADVGNCPNGARASENGGYSDSGEKYIFEVNKSAVEFALSSEVTRKNRLVLLNLFGRRYDTKLYSFQTFQMLEGVVQCGTVDYVSELPFVIANSKINLNPILRCTQTGIPLRAFDIMGYGGFLLSSYQTELKEEFMEGRDMEMYRSYEEALEKADYYLKHNDERCVIARNAQKKVLEKHTLQIRFDEILKKSNVL